MKRYGLLLITICIAFFACIQAPAQAKKSKQSTTDKVLSKIHAVNLNDSIEIYKELLKNTPIEPEFMLMPRFAIVDGHGKFVFSVGANLKFTASYDWGNPVNNPKGMNLNKITKSLPGDHQLFQMSAGGSGIFFNILGFPNSANAIGLFISIGVDDGDNNKYVLDAGQIYMRFREFKAGYATSLYSDKAADAYNIDGEGACASGSHSCVQVNWQHKFTPRIGFGAGVELPSVSLTHITEGLPEEIEQLKQKTARQNIPDIPAYVDYNWDEGRSHVRLSTMLRTMHYVDFIEKKDRYKPGWGLKLTTALDFSPFKIFGMMQGGRGIANFIHDNSDLGLDMVPDQNDAGNMLLTSSLGAIAAVQYNISPKMFVTAQYSFLRNIVPEYTMESTHPFKDQIRIGHTATANFIWRISSLFNAGVEYKMGNRRNYDGTSLFHNRLYFMLLMNF